MEILELGLNATSVVIFSLDQIPSKRVERLQDSLMPHLRPRLDLNPVPKKTLISRGYLSGGETRRGACSNGKESPIDPRSI